MTVRQCSLATFLSAAFLGAVTALSTVGQASAQQVGIVAITEHPAFDAARDGIAEELMAAGLPAPIYGAGSGDPASVGDIVGSWVANDVSLIVTLGSAAVLPTLERVEDSTAVIAAAVAPDRIQDGVDGTITDGPPAHELLQLLEQMQPDPQSIGLLVPEGMQAATRPLVAAAAQAGHMIVEIPVRSLPEVLAATQRLMRETSAILVPGSTLAEQSVDAIVAIASGGRVPVYSDDPALVDRGVLAAVQVDYYDLGRITGRQILKHLGGEEVGVVQAPGGRIRINGGTAASLGIAVSSDAAGTVELVGG